MIKNIGNLVINKYLGKSVTTKIIKFSFFFCCMKNHPTGVTALRKNNAAG